MSGSQLGAGAAANPNAYANMAAMGTPVQPNMAAQMGTPPYNPSASPLTRPGFDLKSPLAGFAMQMAMQHMAPKGTPQMQLPQHMMGMPPGGQVRNPYGRKL